MELGNFYFENGFIDLAINDGYLKVKNYSENNISKIDFLPKLCICYYLNDQFDEALFLELKNENIPNSLEN